MIDTNDRTLSEATKIRAGLYKMSSELAEENTIVYTIEKNTAGDYPVNRNYWVIQFVITRGGNFHFGDCFESPFVSLAEAKKAVAETNHSWKLDPKWGWVTG